MTLKVVKRVLPLMIAVLVLSVPIAGAADVEVDASRELPSFEITAPFIPPQPKVLATPRNIKASQFRIKHGYSTLYRIVTGMCRQAAADTYIQAGETPYNVLADPQVVKRYERVRRRVNRELDFYGLGFAPAIPDWSSIGGLRIQTGPPRKTPGVPGGYEIPGVVKEWGFICTFRFV